MHVLSTGNLSPGSAAAISVRRQRGRARSITDSDAPSTKPMVRSRSAGKAAIMRVAAAEAAAAEAAATAVDVGVSTPTGLSAAFAEGAAIAPEKNGAGKGESWSASAGMEAAREALEDDMDGGGMRSRRVSSAVREQVQRSLDVDYEPETEEPEVEGAECLEEEQRKQLRARAFAIVVYASGDRYVHLRYPVLLKSPLFESFSKKCEMPSFYSAYSVCESNLYSRKTCIAFPLAKIDRVI